MRDEGMQKKLPHNEMQTVKYYFWLDDFYVILLTFKLLVKRKRVTQLSYFVIPSWQQYEQVALAHTCNKIWGTRNKTLSSLFILYIYLFIYFSTKIFALSL